MSPAPAINIVVTGEFEFPHGMAGTRRVMNVINGLRQFPDVSIHVVVLRQSSARNALNGVYQGIHYETVLRDVLRSKMLLLAPILYAKSRKTMRRLFQPDQHNLLYVYGPPSFDNLPAILYARKLGYKVVFDIVEDYDLALNISKSLWHRTTVKIVCGLTNRIKSLADGLVLISSHLVNKYHNLTDGTMPIHRLPISVDMDRYPEPARNFGNPVTMFYAGSFGVKDGMPVLLDAFDALAARGHNIRLEMTGSGSAEVMGMLHERIAVSPYIDRIRYLGFLDDAAYFAALSSADILCMPRIDIGYAQAGFPFKLGEYLATGKPVIASAVSDVPDMLKDRQDVMLVSPGKSEAIVEAAEFLLAHPEQAFEIGVTGRYSAHRLFDYREQGRQLNTFLRSFVGMGNKE
jgi:glycosyltransferase involved in cell wall biosynthesis